MKVKIKNGRVIDPASGEDQIRDLFIANGAIIDPPKGVTSSQPIRRLMQQIKLSVPDSLIFRLV